MNFKDLEINFKLVGPLRVTEYLSTGRSGELESLAVDPEILELSLSC